MYHDARFYTRQATFLVIHCLCRIPITRGRDRVVGIATRYRMDGLAFKPRWSEFFLPQDPPSFLFNTYRVGGGVKWPGCGAYHPPLLTPSWNG